MISSWGEARRRRWLLRTSATRSNETAGVGAALIEGPAFDPATLPLTPWQVFARDCAASPRARLWMKVDGGLELSTPLTDPVLFIGAGPECRLRCVDANLDRRHYALFWLAGSLYGVDLHRALRDPGAMFDCWWMENNALDVGPFRLRATGISQTISRDDSDRSTALPLQIQWTAETRSHVEPLRARLTLIGSGPGCSIRLHDARLAPVQAALVRTRRSLGLFDLAGNTWTRQAGRPIERSLLDPGDEFEIGRTSFDVSAVWDEPWVAPAVSPWQEFVQQQTARVAELQQLLNQMRRSPPDVETQRQLLERIRTISTACAVDAEFSERRA